VIEISGLGLGVGYNRQILVPTDMNQIPEFIIVEALDRPEVFAEDPMGELLQIRKSMPPRRGSYWVAVGLRGTSFAVVNVTAILYVALDRGFEIGVLGVGRLSLRDRAPLLNIELALKARFSSAEGVLSIQAQLTDNCWFLFPNCQLTGGFAFYMCFPKSQFLLTIGGYHPNFSKPPEFPIVPRLGFKYSMIIYSIKGESYFALTNSCVMFGTRLELAYGFDWLQAWLTAYADFLISWDPFFYMARVGIEIGVRVRIEVCFIECVHVTLSLSVGASLELAGPPMHGKVTVDLDVVSFTIPFGDEPRPDTKHLLWPQFRLKYLYTDDPAGHAVTVHALEGLLPPEPAGAEPAPGTESQPWRLSSEWSFETTSTMAAQALMTRAGEVIEVEGVYDHLDVAPMGKDHVKSYHLAEFFGRSGSQWSPASSSQIRFQAVVKQLSEAIWLYYGEGKVPAAANTLPLVTGVRIVGSAAAVNPSGLIPIGKLVDVSNSRPLPFAGTELFSMYVQFGAAAESLASQALGLSNRSAASVARDVLSGAGTFADARRSLGLPGEGLPAMAVRSLERRRSAPPLLTPVSTGLTMKPVGLGAPPVIDEVPPGEVAVLERPRLKTIMQTRPPVVADQPPSARTSVASMAADGVPRMSAPRPDFVTGARLLRVPAPDSTRPTAMPSFGRTVRNVEAGSSPAASHVQAFDKAQADFESGGIRIPSGTTYVWDVPLATGRRLLLSGTAAVRVSFLTGNGTLLQDAEIASPREEETTFPANATMVAVSCLGRAPDSGVPLSPSFGAVSAMAAPPGARAATGWQTGNVACQVGGSALLVRGGYLRLPAHALSFHFDQQIGQSAVKLSDVMIDQEGAETWLPASTSVLMVLLDAQEVTAAEEGDLAITVDGARPGSPLRVTGGRRRAVLYDVLERVGQREFLTVAVASRRGFRLAGVVGLPGKAQEWATRLNGEVPAHLVPDGPLTPDGEVVARLAGLDGGHP